MGFNRLRPAGVDGRQYLIGATGCGGAQGMRCGGLRVCENRGMAEEPECHKVEWTRLEIGERAWRVKLEYG